MVTATRRPAGLSRLPAPKVNEMRRPTRQPRQTAWSDAGTSSDTVKRCSSGSA